VIFAIFKIHDFHGVFMVRNDFFMAFSRIFTVLRFRVFRVFVFFVISHENS